MIKYTKIKKKINEKKFNDCLRIIQNEVEEIIYNTKYTSKKFIGKKVIMIDGSNRKNVLELLKCADVFIFLSNIEASPLVLFEAAASGTPFIATAAGNSAEIAKWTQGGIIVKTYPKENGRVRAHLKDALLKTIALIYNKPLRARLSKNARKNWDDKYTWNKITDEYLNLYKELISKKVK